MLCSISLKDFISNNEIDEQIANCKMDAKKRRSGFKDPGFSIKEQDSLYKGFERTRTNFKKIYKKKAVKDEVSHYILILSLLNFQYEVINIH